MGTPISSLVSHMQIVLSTYMTMVELKHQKQEFKYKQYLSLAILLIIALSISIILAFFEAYVDLLFLVDELEQLSLPNSKMNILPFSGCGLPIGNSSISHVYFRSLSFGDLERTTLLMHTLPNSPKWRLSPLAK